MDNFLDKMTKKRKAEEEIERRKQLLEDEYNNPSEAQKIPSYKEEDYQAPVKLPYMNEKEKESKWSRILQKVKK